MQEWSAPTIDLRGFSLEFRFMNLNPATLTCTLGLGLVIGWVHAEPPKVDWMFPMGAQRGSEVSVEIGGKFEPWPMTCWSEHPGIRFTADEKKKGHFKVTVDKHVMPGPHLVRFHNPEGAVAPRVFLVGKARDVLDKEPNNQPEVAQVIGELPVQVQGKLDNGDAVDVFKVSLQAGQMLIASLDAYRCGVPMDALLMLRNARGVKLAFNHDAHSLDPRLVWKCDQDGDYLLQLAAFKFPPNASSAFSGSAEQVYRLTITNGPFVRHSIPGGLQWRMNSNLHFTGWNLTSASTAVPGQCGLKSIVPVDAVNGPLVLPVSVFPELLEQEPNDDISTAPTLPIPGSVSGQILMSGDVDRYAFVATKDQLMHFEVEAFRLGFLLDARLSIEDLQGKELASNDDTNGMRDPELTWPAPGEGRYFVVVQSLLRKGGDEHFYRLHANRSDRSFSAETSTHMCTLKQGETMEVKVKLKFHHDYHGRLLLHVPTLPAGVTVSSVEVDTSERPETKIDPKTGKLPPPKFMLSREITMEIKADKEAPPINAPLQIYVREVDGQQFVPVECDLTSAGMDNGVPQGFPEFIVPRSPHLWLTVILPPKPPTPKKDMPRPGPIRVNLADKPPVIDGKLEEAWESAATISYFVLLGGMEPPKAKTKGYLLYDDKFIYVAAECDETGRQKPLITGGPVYQDDAIEIWFDENVDGMTFNQLIVNAVGSSQGFGPSGMAELKVQTATHLEAGKRWTVEVAIPYTSLRVPAPKAGEAWGFNLCRNRPQGEGVPRELITWSYLETKFKEMELFGKIQFGSGEAADKPFNSKCPVLDRPINTEHTFTYKGKIIAFCSADCLAQFKKEPEKFFAKVKPE